MSKLAVASVGTSSSGAAAVVPALHLTAGVTSGLLLDFAIGVLQLLPRWVIFEPSAFQQWLYYSPRDAQSMSQFLPRQCCGRLVYHLQQMLRAQAGLSSRPYR